MVVPPNTSAAVTPVMLWAKPFLRVIVTVTFVPLEIEVELRAIAPVKHPMATVLDVAGFDVAAPVESLSLVILK